MPCTVYIDTVDGSEIWLSPVEAGRLSHYLQGFLHLLMAMVCRDCVT